MVDDNTVFFLDLRMTIVGCTLESLRMQEDEYGALEKSLEDQHVRCLRCETLETITTNICVSWPIAGNSQLDFQFHFCGDRSKVGG
jgi:hypothetical protein